MRQLRYQPQFGAGTLIVVRPAWWCGDRRTEALARVVAAEGRRYAVRRWHPTSRRWGTVRLYPAFAVVRKAHMDDLAGVELGHHSPDQLALEIP